MTFLYSFSHEYIGTSRIPRTCWWARRARTSCKYSWSTLFHTVWKWPLNLKADFSLCHFITGSCWFSWSSWTSWQKWWRCECYNILKRCINFSHLYTLLVLTSSFIFLSKGNNGRPGKPGDRGAPGAQVRASKLTFLFKPSMFVSTSVRSFIFALSSTGCSWFPRNSWTSWHEGTQSKCLVLITDEKTLLAFSHQFQHFSYWSESLHVVSRAYRDEQVL